jgi:DNA-binding CsgD family transcriptional regulator
VSTLGPDELLFRLSELSDVGDDRDRLQSRLSLTSREAEVLLWLSRGKSNRDIGEILTISPRTVNKHLQQVFEKLGVENRAAAAAQAVRALAC